MQKKSNLYNKIMEQVAKEVKRSLNEVDDIAPVKQEFSGESYKDLPDTLDNHLRGELCETCKEVIELEMGNYFFYIASLCDTLGLDLNEVMQEEYNRNKTLGLFNLR